MGIIDSHVHHYPSGLVKDPQAWAKTHKEYYWASLVGPNSVQGWASTDKLLKDMDRAGIEKAVLLGWYWENQESCEAHNQFQAECLKEHPDRFLAFATVQPLAGDQALDSLKYAIDVGHCGIGEIFHKAQGFEITNPTWLKIVEWANEQDLPINMHVTEPVGHQYPGRTHAPLSDYQWLAEQFPNLKLILAHWGGLLPFYELNPAFKKASTNIYYDTAASPLLYDNTIFQSVIDCIGAEKILYGSDYPLRLYPRRQSEPDFHEFLSNIKGLSLGKSTEEAILGNNAKKILVCK